MGYIASIYIIALLLLRVTQPDAEAESGVPGSDTLPGAVTAYDTLHVDVGASIVNWKGTKFWGLGKHEGSIRLSSGYLVIEDEKIVSARFVIDMNSMQITDMPRHETVPRNRLLRHLKSEDFFHVAAYPVAIYSVHESSAIRQGTMRIQGTLFMRGVSHPVELDASVVENSDDYFEVEASFTINRQDWGVAYRGSSLTNDLVDDTIYLDLKLVARAGSASFSSEESSLP